MPASPAGREGGAEMGGAAFVLGSWAMFAAWAQAPDVSAALPPDELTIGVEVDRGASFGRIMQRFDLPPHTLSHLATRVPVGAGRAGVDLSRIRPERELQLTFVDGSSVATRVRVELDAERALVLSQEDGAWTADLESVLWSTREVQIGLVLRGGWWSTLANAGLPPTALSAVKAALDGAVDLDDLSPGDRLELVAEWRSAPGREPRLGIVHAVRWIGRDRLVEAVRFQRDDGREGWFAPTGLSLAGSFLRSPLDVYEVSSDFSWRRFHPVLRVGRPHTGTDLVAPRGTPIRSPSDGVVVAAGWNGSHGQYVEIQHSDTITTSYSHLARVMVRRGMTVRQGEHIGLVGTTGLSTGPHLHYQMWKNGRFVDPMTVDLPRVEPLTDAELTRFLPSAERWMSAFPADGLLGVRDLPPSTVGGPDGGAGFAEQVAPAAPSLPLAFTFDPSADAVPLASLPFGMGFDPLAAL